MSTQITRFIVHQFCYTQVCRDRIYRPQSLPLNKPQAFVITLEQPGGVVKSKQEKVVALAKL